MPKYRDAAVKKQIQDLKKFNELLKYQRKIGQKLFFIGPNWEYKTKAEATSSKEYTSLTNCTLIIQKLTKIEVITKYNPFNLSKPNGTYMFNLNDDVELEFSGRNCYAEMSKYYKVPDFRKTELADKYVDTETGKFVLSARPLVSFNEEYNETKLQNVYEYDLNSAYAAAMLKKIPDTNSPRYSGKVHKNEIGFLLIDELPTVYTGYADVIFPLIDTPKELLEYITKYYNIKKTAIDSNTKANAKARLNLPIGYTQRTNPFFRSYIVNTCNDFITNLIDENTLLCNTDAIFSRVKRTDLEIGNEIGQFKEIKIDNFYYRGNNYQADLDIPVYRGIPKKWFIGFAKLNSRPWDMSIDEVPERINLYYLDKDRLEIRKDKIWQEEEDQQKEEE